MLDKHSHLLLRYESLEVLPRLIWIHSFELRLDAIPNDTPSRGEEVVHEGTLTGDLHLNSAITKTIRAAAKDARTMALNGSHSIIEGLKLDIRVHGLAGHALHDDVHRLLLIGEDLCRAT